MHIVGVGLKVKHTGGLHLPGLLIPKMGGKTEFCILIYDASHFRNAVGTMVLAEIFGNEDVYRPDDFGAFVTAGTCGAYLAKTVPFMPYSSRRGHAIS